jgi:excisionase family DNA binding protein
MSNELLLTVEQAAQRLSLSVSYLNKARMQGGVGPRYIKIGRSVRYRECDLAEWVESHAAGSTSEYLGGQS